MSPENRKKLPAVILIRMPIMGTLILINIIGGYIWDYSDRLISYLGNKLPGLTKDESGKS